MCKKWIILIGMMLIPELLLYSADVRFYSVNELYGISMRETYSICRDGNGFVWASSKTGLLRITEDECRTYQLPYRTPGNVSVKLVFENERLIAYTHNGQLFSYDEIHDRFNLVADLRTFLDSSFGINALAVDDRGRFWIATSTGLFLYEEDTDSLESVSDSGYDVQYIIPFDEKQLFLATQKGISLIRSDTYEKEALYTFSTDHEIRVSVFFHDKAADRLWIGSLSKGLFRYDLKTKRLSGLPLADYPRQPILAIGENSDSTLLIGFDGQGIWEIRKDGRSVVNVYKEDPDNPYSLRGDGVYGLLRDENKRIWIATYSGGVSFFDQESPVVTQITHKINDSNSLFDNHVNKVLEDSRGNIWFATNNGVSRWDPVSDRWDGFYRNKHEQARAFLALGEDTDGNIWAGTYSSGVYVLDGITGRELAHHTHEGRRSDFSGKFVLDIFRDRKGDMWIGGVSSEIMRYSLRDNRFYAYRDEPIRSLAEFPPDKILLACTYGLLLLDPVSGQKETLLDGYVVQDAVALGNDIWVATSGNGLIRYVYPSGQTTVFTTESGLVSDYVNSLLPDEGYLWVGTENGLCAFDLSEGKVIAYPAVFPLSHLSFNGGASCKLSNGELIWGTSNGAVLFNPELLVNNRFEGRIFFQDIFVGGRSIRENPGLLGETPVDRQTELILKYDQHTIGLELLSLGVSAPGSKFSWHLEGVDPEWSQPSTRPAINYANLPAGDFRLDIKMFDHSLSQVIDERSLMLRVSPPFWTTWWFFGLVFLIAAGMLYSLLKMYIDRLRQKHAEDKVRFFTNVAHDIRTSLTLVSAPIEALKEESHLSDKGRYYLDLASDQSGRLSDVATQLLDFQKADIGKGQLFIGRTDIVGLVLSRKRLFDAAAEKKEVTLGFSSDRESYVTGIDGLKMEKVIDNLISNAVKYSYSGGRVEIGLHCTDQEWSLEVKDHGPGIPEQVLKKLFKEFYRGENPVNAGVVGSGIGLVLIKNYVSLHGGSVSVESREGEGATFTVTVPYRETVDGSPDFVPEEQTPVLSKREPDSDGFSLSEKGDSYGKPHILLVEDNAVLRKFLQSSLEETYRISMSGDGAEAWELIRKKSPDLIISDVMMPEMDGFELCRLIKSTFETAHIPVILLTALAGKAEQLEGLGWGADDYVTKPFDLSVLSQRIVSILKNREVIRERALRLLSERDDEQPLLENELNDTFVKRAVEAIRDNMANCAFGKEEFASLMNVSPSLLYKKLKALTGQSPVELIRTVRLNRGLELLRSRKYTVAEVSELCGFASASYFSTVFKKQFGRSPMEYL